MVEIASLAWDEANLNHLEERGVDAWEVEEVVQGLHHDFTRGHDRLFVLGQTDAGRYLTIVMQPMGWGTWRPITARDSSRNEVRLLNRHIAGRGR